MDESGSTELVRKLCRVWEDAPASSIKVSHVSESGVLLEMRFKNYSLYARGSFPLQPASRGYAQLMVFDGNNQIMDYSEELPPTPTAVFAPIYAKVIERMQSQIEYVKEEKQRALQTSKRTLNELLSELA